MLRKISNNPNGEERRNRQITIVVKPSVYEAARQLGSIRNCSANNIINLALEKYIIDAQHELEGKHEEEK